LEQFGQFLEERGRLINALGPGFVVLQDGAGKNHSIAFPLVYVSLSLSCMSLYLHECFSFIYICTVVVSSSSLFLVLACCGELWLWTVECVVVVVSFVVVVIWRLVVERRRGKRRIGTDCENICQEPAQSHSVFQPSWCIRIAARLSD
jgi:hypothetical protein